MKPDIHKYRYQLNDLEKIKNDWKHPYNGILAYDMGLGKSGVSLRSRSKKAPTIVVCPSSLKYNWESECSMWGAKSTILETRTPKESPTKQDTRRDHVYIINYEILPYWKKWLKKLKARTLIVDESHRIRNPTSKAAITLYHFRYTKRKLFLTGTPIWSSPIDLWVPLHLIDEDEFPSYFKFGYQFCRVKRQPRFRKVTFEGGKNLDVLHAKLKPYMIRRNKENTLELKGKQRHFIYVDLPPKEMKQYQKAEQDFVTWMLKKKNKLPENVQKNVENQKIIQLKKLIGELKKPISIEWIEDFRHNSSSKLLVFGYHVKLLEDMHHHFENSLLLNGKVPAKLKRERHVKFQTKKKHREMFANFTAGGIGWNGTAASDVFFPELSWIPHELTQCEDRAYRIGQKRRVDVFYLIAKNTIEETVCRKLTERQAVSDKALDGKLRKNSLQFNMNLKESDMVAEIKRRLFAKYRKS